MADFSTKSEMLDKLRAYATTPDDDSIRYKNIIKKVLLGCPELLYSLHIKEFESELFDEDGNLIEDGEWDIYFGEHAPIRPYLFFPDIQTDMKSYICYQVSFEDMPRYNKIEKYATITFTIFVYSEENMDKETGIARHDLLGSIIREKFNWKNMFGTQCNLIDSYEGSSDGNFVVKKLTFRNTVTNSILKTEKGQTKTINKFGA